MGGANLSINRDSAILTDLVCPCRQSASFDVNVTAPPELARKAYRTPCDERLSGHYVF